MRRKVNVVPAPGVELFLPNQYGPSLASLKRETKTMETTGGKRLWRFEKRN
jgi:hypothetical protein